MKIQVIKTKKMLPPQDNLWEVLDRLVVPKLKANMIVAITSKIVSIGEGRCIPINQVKDKDKLIIKEAEKYLPKKYTPGEWVMHTLKHNLLIPTAGIDESNANGYYILYPKDPEKSAKLIWKFLVGRSGVKNLGIVITDTHSVPLRRGVMGVSLASWGFYPLQDYRGEEDLFGRELKFTQTNLPDSLSATATLAMGEGAEGTPICLISALHHKIKFTNRQLRAKSPELEFQIPLEYDLYKPFLVSVPWKRGGSGK